MPRKTAEFQKYFRGPTKAPEKYSQEPPKAPDGSNNLSSMRGGARMMRLLYRVVPHNGGVVFATESRARLIASIHQALDSCRTWGEFRQAVPLEVYESLIAGESDEEAEPQPQDHFDGTLFTADGDFPPWLQSEMDLVLPRDILDAFATSKSTFLNGSFWDIPEQKMSAVVDALRRRGYVVKHEQDLPFH